MFLLEELIVGLMKHWKNWSKSLVRIVGMHVSIIVYDSEKHVWVRHSDVSHIACMDWQQLELHAIYRFDICVRL